MIIVDDVDEAVIFSTATHKPIPSIDCTLRIPAKPSNPQLVKKSFNTDPDGIPSRINSPGDVPVLSRTLNVSQP